MFISVLAESDPLSVKSKTALLPVSLLYGKELGQRHPNFFTGMLLQASGIILQAGLGQGGPLWSRSQEEEPADHSVCRPRWRLWWARRILDNPGLGHVLQDPGELPGKRDIA